MFADLNRYEITVCFVYEQSVPLCRNEEAAPWILRQLGLLAYQTVCMVLGTEFCSCWQCLLTVGGNLLPRIVTPFDVTTVA